VVHKDKKAQGLSLQTIVLAALALFVLIVLIIIFGGRLTPASDFYKDCDSVEGKSVEGTTEDPPSCPPSEDSDKTISHPLYKSKEGETMKICCVDKLI